MNKPDFSLLEEALIARQTEHWSDLDERLWRAYKFERACEDEARKRGLLDDD